MAAVVQPQPHPQLSLGYVAAALVAQPLARLQVVQLGAVRYTALAAGEQDLAFQALAALDGLLKFFTARGLDSCVSAV